MNPVVVPIHVQQDVEQLPSGAKKNIQSALQDLQHGLHAPDRKLKNIADNIWVWQADQEYQVRFQLETDEIKIVQVRRRTDREKEAENDLVISYMFLRKLIGIFGMLLPLALALFPKRPTTAFLGLEPSLSDYYYTERGDFLVVLLSILGIFLFTYRGYYKMERLLTRTAALCAFGVAFVPTQVKCDKCPFSVHTLEGGVLGNIHGEGLHLVCAGVFLLCLAFISTKYFPQTDASTLTKPNNGLTQKGKRNLVFKTCGWVMFSCVFLLVLFFVLNYLFGINLKDFPLIFVLETIAVEAFGISWLTKGEVLLPDNS